MNKTRYNIVKELSIMKKTTKDDIKDYRLEAKWLVGAQSNADTHTG
jgi:hypothetical protein